MAQSIKLGSDTYLDASGIVMHTSHTTLETALNGGTVLLDNETISTTMNQFTLADDIYNYRGILFDVEIGSYHGTLYLPRVAIKAQHYIISVPYNTDTYFMSVDVILSTGTTLRAIISTEGASWSGTPKLSVYGCGIRG